MPLASVFFVDDDPAAGRIFRRFAEAAGYDLQVFQEPLVALDAFKAHRSDAVITDLKMPGMSGIDFLSELRKIDPRIPVIVITGYASADNAIEALRLGANDFIKKPYDADELLHRLGQTLESAALQQENRALRLELGQNAPESSLLGESKPIRELRQLVGRLAPVRCNVIVSGESGTGKELVARDLHYQSPWADKPYVVIDCGSLSDSLLESELFGHEKGAFTGADQRRIGRLESARGGTVFLDEICNISDAMQTKLLRVVQEQKITRVGGVEQIDIDVRFVTATNRDLAQMVRDGHFREDLYHRLNVVRIDVPPLRAREGDVEILLNHFLGVFSAKYQRRIKGVDIDSMQWLTQWAWPGNVRELKNLVERHVVLADADKLLIRPAEPELTGNASATDAIDADNPDLKTLERRYIGKTLLRCNGNKEQTAAALGIDKSTLWRKLRQYERN